MNQQNILGQDEFQTTHTEEPLFEEQTVQRIPAVVPLAETPTSASSRSRRRDSLKRFRVPMRRENNSFNPVFMVLALIAVTALGVIAGTLLYRTAAQGSANNKALTETDEPMNRTIPAQQFVVEKPEGIDAPSASKSDLNSLSMPSSSSSSSYSSPSSETLKKNSVNRPENSALSSDESDEQRETPAANEETVEEEQPKIKAPSATKEDADDEEPPPAPVPAKSNRKQNKTTEKKTNSNQPESQTSAEPAVTGSGGVSLDN